MDLEGNKTWYTKYKDLQQNLDLPQEPIHITKHSLKIFHKRVEKTMESNYNEYWNQQVKSLNGKNKGKGLPVSG